MVKGFLLVWGRLLFHGFPASLRKNKTTSVKEQLFSDRKTADLIWTPALSLSPVTCVSVSSHWLSSSLSGTHERRFVRSPLPTTPIPSSPPHPQPNPSEASWREISLSANSGSPVQFSLELHSPEGEAAAGRWKDRLSADTKGVWRDKGSTRGLWTTEQQPPVTQDRDSRQRNTVTRSR